MIIEDIFEDDLNDINRGLNDVNTDFRPNYQPIDAIYNSITTEDIAQSVRRFNTRFSGDTEHIWVEVEDLNLEIDNTIDLHLDDIVDIIDTLETADPIDYTESYKYIQWGIENVAQNQVDFALMFNNLTQDSINRTESAQNNIADSFKDSINSAIEHFTDDLTDLSEKIASGVSESIDFVGEKLSDAYDGFIEGFDNSMLAVEEVMDSVGDYMEKLLLDLIVLLREIFMIEPEKIKEHMQTFYDIFQSFVKGLT